MNQNNYNPSVNQAPLQPDLDPTGTALAPFPEDDNPGARKNFNYDNLHRRYPSKPGVDNRFSNDGGSNVPLANYGSSQVPLAPL